jgi:hypothetical protein
MVNRSDPDTSDLPNQFFIDWAAQMSALGINPEHTLMVSNSESIGVDPKAYNPAGAAGLIQFTSIALGRIGFHGSVKDITSLSAVEQVPLAAKYYTDYAKYITSPAIAYLANAAPAALPYIKDGDWNAKLPQAIYSGNSGFDDTHKGYITLGDLDRHVRNATYNNRWYAIRQRLLSAMTGDLTPDADIVIPNSGDLAAQAAAVSSINANLGSPGVGGNAGPYVPKKQPAGPSPYVAVSYQPQQQSQGNIARLSQGSAGTTLLKAGAVGLLTGGGIYLGYLAWKKWG